MKKLAVILSAALLYAPLAGAADISYAVVDMQSLLSESEAAKSINTQREAHLDKVKAELIEKQKAFGALQESMAMDHGSLNSSDVKKQRQELGQRFAEIQEYAQSSKDNIEAAYSSAMSSLMDHTYDTIEDVSKEKGHTLVLNKHSIAYAKDAVDISDDVMARLNEAVQKIDLNLE